MYTKPGRAKARRNQRFALRTAQQDVDQIKSIESMLTHSLSQIPDREGDSGQSVALMERPLIVELCGGGRTVRPDGRRSAHPAPSRARLAVDRSARNKGSAPASDRVQRALAQLPTSSRSPCPPAWCRTRCRRESTWNSAPIAYHSSTTFTDHVLRYSRTLEVKQLSVPASQAEELKRFFRTIEGDERNSAVLKLASP